MWHHPEALTNILLLQYMVKTFRVTYDSSERNSFFVHKADGAREFKATNKGLYILDLQEQNGTRKEDNYQFLTTVEQNKQGFPQRAVKGAERAK